MLRSPDPLGAPRLAVCAGGGKFPGDLEITNYTNVNSMTEASAERHQGPKRVVEWRCLSLRLLMAREVGCTTYAAHLLGHDQALFPRLSQGRGTLGFWGQCMRFTAPS
jgi:hypothetical protein